MRGQVDGQQAMFVAFNIEERVPLDHPLRAIKSGCDAILKDMSRDFNAAYGHTGRVGIPPESLIKSLLLRAIFAIPSKRRLCQACDFNILYRWFVDWPIEKPIWTPEVFSMSRDRFEMHDLVGKFFQRIVSASCPPADASKNGDEFISCESEAWEVCRAGDRLGWCKHIGGLNQTRFIGHERIQADAMLVASAWNLIRMTRLKAKSSP